jgi:hypothetical protein
LRRGNSAGAIARLDDAATIAEANHAFSVATHAREAAALHAYASNSPGAATRLIAATRMLSDDSMLLYICDLKALAAELDFETGDVELARHLLDEAKTSVQFPEQLVELEILNVRIKAFSAFYFVKAESLSEGNWHDGEDHLLRAWWAYGTQNEKAAISELGQAEGAGVLTTFFAEDALLLSSLLTAKDAPCDVDPPYPDYFRLSACRALENVRKQRRQVGHQPST